MFRRKRLFSPPTIILLQETLEESRTCLCDSLHQIVGLLLLYNLTLLPPQAASPSMKFSRILSKMTLLPRQSDALCIKFSREFFTRCVTLLFNPSYFMRQALVFLYHRSAYSVIELVEILKIYLSLSWKSSIKRSIASVIAANRGLSFLIMTEAK